MPGDRRAHYFNSLQVVDRARRAARPLRQATPRAVRRISAVRRFLRSFRRDAIRALSRRLRRRASALRSSTFPACRTLSRSSATRRSFPQEIGSLFRPGDNRRAWMLNVTDDAWFGITPGPYQHFAQARLRAIEQGLPLVRAANTGVSAVVDGLGRVIAQLPLGVEGVLDSSLPAPRPPTFYSRFGALTPLAMGLSSCCRRWFRKRGSGGDPAFRPLPRARPACRRFRGLRDRRRAFDRRRPIAVHADGRRRPIGRFRTNSRLLQGFIERQIHPLLWDPILLHMLMLPNWLVLGLFGAGLFYLVRRRPPPIGHSNRRTLRRGAATLKPPRRARRANAACEPRVRCRRRRSARKI